MDDHIILRFVVRLLFPFIIMYGLYVQFHGEYSPGGGFQAGVICAAAFISYGLIYGLADVMKVLPLWSVRVLSAVGLLTYAGTGVVTMLKGGRFLEYSVLSQNAVSGQMLGIFVIEIGVGLTVFAVMMIIFYMFGERSK